MKICLYPRSPQGKDSWHLEGIYHVRTIAKDRDTGHEYHLDSLNYTTNFKWSLQLEEDRLLHEYLLALVAKSFYFSLEEIDLLRNL